MSKNLSKIDHAILETISFFDVLGIPLNSTEIYNYLYKYKCTFTELEKSIEELVARSRIEKINSYFVLSGHGDKLIENKSESNKYIIKLTKRAKKATKILSTCPYIKAVLVCNSLAFENVNKESDIDLLIITKRNRIFLARFIATLVIHIFGFRRHGNKIDGRVCLSFFLSEDALDLNIVAIKPEDIYLTYWLVTLIPYIGLKKYNEILNKNIWAIKKLPNFKKPQNLKELKTGKISKIVSSSLETVLEITGLGFLLNKVLRKWLKSRAKKKIEKLKLSKAVNSCGIIVTDTLQKFHDQDQRADIYAKWRDRVTRFRI